MHSDLPSEHVRHIQRRQLRRGRRDGVHVRRLLRVAAASSLATAAALAAASTCAALAASAAACSVLHAVQAQHVR